MRVRTLVATADTAYTKHISDYISEHHADSIEIGTCNTAEQLNGALGAGRFDVALMDAALIKQADLNAVNLPVLLWEDGKAESMGIAAGAEGSAGGELHSIRVIKKHMRISFMVAEILQQYAAITGKAHVSDEAEGNITAVWSPGGGVGKTTVALAYAASKAAREKEVFYLNLESFATTPVYFGAYGKSISSVFEMLEGNGGNAKMLVSGIRGCKNGITYLGAPENFDDMCILSPENICELVTYCAGTTNELVIDLSCVCDARTRQVLDLSDNVLLVVDRSETIKTKLAQFISQSDAFGSIKDKITLVVNKCKALTDSDKVAVAGDFSKKAVMLPYIADGDEEYVYKTLVRELGVRELGVRS